MPRRYRERTSGILGDVPTTKEVDKMTTLAPFALRAPRL
jgi:hypothetical protein